LRAPSLPQAGGVTPGHDPDPCVEPIASEADSRVPDCVEQVLVEQGVEVIHS
jgi:hypothetical protein